MNISIEDVSPVRKKISFEIPEERVHGELEKAYRNYQKQVQIPGFRAGRVPRQVLENRFREQIEAEVSSALVEESLARAVKENALAVVTKPEIITEKLVVGQPFRYAATVETKPSIKDVAYKGVEVEKALASVEEEEVDGSMDRLAESFAQLRPIADREVVAESDVVTMDYRAERDGLPLPGLDATAQAVEMGKKSLLPGFEEQIIGSKKGSTVEFSLPLPGQIGEEDSEKKNASSADFRVTIRDIAAKEVPVLDDEFAKDHGECDTLLELRAKVRSNLEEIAERKAEGEMQQEVLSQVLRRNPFEVPNGLVREQAQQLFAESGMSGGRNIAFDDPTMPEALRDSFSQRAKRQIETTFLLDTLAGELSLTVSPEELDQKVEELVGQNGQHGEEIRNFYSDRDNRGMLEGRMVREKALDEILDKANVRQGKEKSDVAGPGESD